MKKFEVRIYCENDAFADATLPEVARILRELADKLELDGVTGLFQNLRDINGNVVGVYKAHMR